MVGDIIADSRATSPGIRNQEQPLMRVYIIGNDGIMLCRKTPATVNDGEVAVASNAELHAAPLSAKRLLALWNALPGVPKRRKVGDHDALIDKLWSAIEMLPDPVPQSGPKRAHPWRPGPRVAAAPSDFGGRLRVSVVRVFETRGWVN
jgi:hypothetical protein